MMASPLVPYVKIMLFCPSLQSAVMRVLRISLGSQAVALISVCWVTVTRAEPAAAALASALAVMESPARVSITQPSLFQTVLHNSIPHYSAFFSAYSDNFLCFSSEPEHELFLVYGKGRPGVIRGMDMHARVYDEHIIPIENLNNPRALDFHAETEFIYFADATSYIIGRQKIDGTERDIIVKDGEC